LNVYYKDTIPKITSRLEKRQQLNVMVE